MKLLNKCIRMEWIIFDIKRNILWLLVFIKQKVILFWLTSFDYEIFQLFLV